MAKKRKILCPRCGRERGKKQNTQFCGHCGASFADKNSDDEQDHKQRSNGAHDDDSTDESDDDDRGGDLEAFKRALQNPGRIRPVLQIPPTKRAPVNADAYSSTSEDEDSEDISDSDDEEEDPIKIEKEARVRRLRDAGYQVT